MESIQLIEKRDGSRVPYERVKITNAILKAAQAVNSKHGRPWAENLARRIEVSLIQQVSANGHRPHVEDIQDIVEQVLI